MMRQTPIDFLKHYVNVPNFTTQNTKLTHNYIQRKLTGPNEDPTTGMIQRELPLSTKSHPSPISKVLGKEDLLKCHQTKCKTILTLQNPPWAQPISPIKNISLTKEQAKEVLPIQFKNQLKNGTLVFFSDGSLLPQQGGGVASALELTQDHITTHSHPKAVALFSENQAALTSAVLPKRNSEAQHLQLKLYTSLQ
ncbi:hypothetical protein O181_065896 [Austropuccinia psidii MF-1]|uniref:Uncharacterized protein n=1 Tax=Austropuccinia psidii MF-1 TaxID=1389203 RepID=A0A9Q3I1N1_9BASI|nr:hypothetical protein [Austropuccinia psidii MF-1]